MDDYPGQYKHLIILLFLLGYLGVVPFIVSVIVGTALYGPVTAVPHILMFAEYVVKDISLYKKLYLTQSDSEKPTLNTRTWLNSLFSK